MCSSDLVTMSLFFGLSIVADVSAKQILKIGIGDPLESEMGAISTRFKQIIEQRTDGKYEIQIFPSCQLGDETEMIQNVRRGNLDMAVVGIANTVPFVKKLGILTLPYLYRDIFDVVLYPITLITTSLLIVGTCGRPSQQAGVRSGRPGWLPRVAGRRAAGNAGRPRPGGAAVMRSFADTVYDSSARRWGPGESGAYHRGRTPLGCGHEQHRVRQSLSARAVDRDAGL